MTVFVIIILALFTGLIYVVILLLTRLFQFFKKTENINKRKFRLTSITASFIIAGLATYFLLFTSPVTNYKTAYIEQEQQGYIVTLKGKRLYMVHDPISILLRQTYADSVQYLLPRSEGIIKGQELPTEKEHYQLKGSITINDKHLQIDLYGDNYDDHTIDPSIWNGTYTLVRR